MKEWLKMSKIIVVSLFLLSIPHQCYTTNVRGPEVKTRSGIVEGERKVQVTGSIDAFLGIPFAAKPVGSLRFSSPQREEPWSGVRKTVKRADACIQIPSGFTKLPIVQQSEDCLYLDVYTPSKATSETLPVLVFFYGGSYIFGNDDFALYDAVQLVGYAEKQGTPVIVVVPNYRLDIFGFLGANVFRGPDNSTGNWGIQDQRAALQWVQESIAGFGGDPNQITIMGQSAGAASVSVHMVANRSRHLYHRAIMDSGAPTSTWVSQPMVTAEEIFLRVMGKIKCPIMNRETVFACVRNKSANDLYQASQDINASFVDSWGPVVDGVELLDRPYKLFASGDFDQSIPVILGSNSGDGTMFVTLPYDATENDYKAWLFKEFGKNGSKVEALYPAHEFKSPWYASAKIIGDATMTCPARSTARILRHYNVPAYLYYLTLELEIVHFYNRDGVFHGEDLVFLFDKWEFLWKEEEKRLGSSMRDLYLSFIYKGNPNFAPQKTFHWNEYNNSADLAAVFNEPLVMQAGIRKEQCDFWDIFAKEPK
eukprot:m.73470 g.73470  ORF g.73470 m.73470 type:complete len:537 (-) comp12421_c0_seq2:26-1636(-)